MDEKLKERIFGAVILVALAVIFLPMFFNSKVSDELNINQVMPQEPAWPVQEELLKPSEHLQSLTEQTQTIVVPEGDLIAIEMDPEPTAITEHVDVMAPKAVAAALAEEPAPVKAIAAAPKPIAEPKAQPVVAKPAAVSKAAPKAPAVTAAKTPLIAYAIQLGTFESRENAEKFMASLRQAGYTPYIVNYKSQGKTLKRVMVGPEVNRDKADKIAANLQKQFNVKGLVVKYDPRN